MSKTLLTSFFFACVMLLGINASAKEKPMSVDINPDWNNSRVEIVVGDLKETKYKAISFVSSIASVNFKADRIMSVEFRSLDGVWSAARRVSPFVFTLPNSFTHLRIHLDVSAPNDQFSKPFVSWIDGSDALFILSDLLPLEFDGQVIVRHAGSASENLFPNIDSAVLAVLGDRKSRVARGSVSISRIGDWRVDVGEAFDAAEEILSDYSRRFGALSKVSPEILLIRASDALGRWSARAIGSTVIIVSSGMPFQSQELQRLHEQLRHELFHLWLPNSLELKGDYATFYEGFALYQSLKSGVATGRIRFQDMLSTLSSAIRISERVDARISYGSQWRDDRESLYAAGLVSAFATDVALVSSSGGRRSSDSFIREFITSHRGRLDDSKTAIRKYFSGFVELDSVGVGEDLMLRRDSIEKMLQRAGLTRAEGSLAVVKNPSRAQKKVLAVLGYNARARMIQMPIR